MCMCYTLRHTHEVPCIAATPIRIQRFAVTLESSDGSVGHDRLNIAPINSEFPSCAHKKKKLLTVKGIFVRSNPQGELKRNLDLCHRNAKSVAVFESLISRIIK